MAKAAHPGYCERRKKLAAGALGRLWVILYFSRFGLLVSHLTSDDADIRPELPGVEILEKLGDGGMGVVYRARQSLIGRTVALKAFRLADGGVSDREAEFRRRFLREARVLARLDDCEGIPKLYEFAESQDGQVCILMELIKGRDLLSALRETPQTSLAEWGRIIAEAARITHEAHQRGVFHRDLKLENIMVCEDGAVKVMDFGIAAFAEGSLRTRSGDVFGTLYYMAPELLAGASKADERSDVYALAVAMYRLACGCFPINANSTREMALAILRVDPIRPRDFHPELSEAFEEFILKGLAKNPAQRFQTAEEFAQTLEALLDGCVDLSSAGGETMFAESATATEPMTTIAESNGENEKTPILDLTNVIDNGPQASEATAVIHSHSEKTENSNKCKTDSL